MQTPNARQPSRNLSFVIRRLLKLALGVALLVGASQSYAINCAETGARRDDPADPAIDCVHSIITEEQWIGPGVYNYYNISLGPCNGTVNDESSALSCNQAYVESAPCLRGTEITDDWSNPDWGDQGMQDWRGEQSRRTRIRNYQTHFNHQSADGAGGYNCDSTEDPTRLSSWSMFDQQVAHCRAGLAVYAAWTTAEGGDNSIVCGNPKRCDACQLLAGNPVNFGLGAKIQVETDLDAKLTFRRRYVSTRTDFVGSAAWAPTTAYAFSDSPNQVWRNEYEASVKIEVTPFNTIARLRRGDLDSDVFFVRSGTVWSSPKFERGTLLDAPGGGVCYVDRSGLQRYCFDSSGLLTTVDDSSGRTTTVVQGAAGPVQVNDQFGRSLIMAYTAGQLHSVTDPSGQEIDYSYDSWGMLTLVSYVTAGTTHTYLYELGDGQRHLLTGIQDEKSNRYATFGYLGEQATSSAHAGGVDSFQFIYSGFGPSAGAVTVLGPSGASSTVSFTSVGPAIAGTSIPSSTVVGSVSNKVAFLTSLVRSSTNDAGGNITSRTDFSNALTCYGYDTARNLETSVLEGLLSSDTCPNDVASAPPASGTPQRKTLARWHPYWNLKSQEAAPKLITTWIYNGQPDPTNSNAVVTCAPTTALVGDQPIAVLCKRVEQPTSDDNGASGFSATAVGNPRIWQWTYNQYGQKLTEDGPRTDVTDTTTWVYYTDTTATHMPGDLQQVTNPVGQITSYQSYDRNGRVLKMTAPDGSITEYLYHVRGWLTQVKVTPAGGGTAQITNMTYEPTGKVSRVTQPDGSWVENSYDAAQRLVGQKDNLNNIVAYTLDNSGNRVKEEYVDPSGSLQRNIDRSFDALNRVQASVGQ